MFLCVFAAKPFHSVQFRVRRVIIPCIRRQNSPEARVWTLLIIGVIHTFRHIIYGFYPKKLTKYVDYTKVIPYRMRKNRDNTEILQLKYVSGFPGI